MFENYKTEVTITEDLPIDQAYKMLMDSSNVKRTLSELRLSIFANKVAQASTSLVISLFFKLLSAMTAYGSKGTIIWENFQELCQNKNMLGASNIEIALMFNKYFTVKEACKYIGVSRYIYNAKYQSLIEDKALSVNAMKVMKPHCNEDTHFILEIFSDFLDKFKYLPVSKDFHYDNEERQLELEFSLICDNLIDVLGKTIAYYFIKDILRNYGIEAYTIEYLWKQLPFIERKLPNTPYNKSLYINDLIRYGLARKLSKANICRYLLRKSQNYLRSGYIRRRIANLDWEGYGAYSVIDWSGLNKTAVLSFISIFERVANFLNE